MKRLETLGFPEFEETIPMPKPLKADSKILILPWWYGSSFNTDRYNSLINMAKGIMKRNRETQPVVEGVVAVKAKSKYPHQIQSPTQVSGNWIKFRFSTR